MSWILRKKCTNAQRVKHVDVTLLKILGVLHATNRVNTEIPGL